MNATGHVQSINFARDPLRPYFDEPQKKKNEIILFTFVYNRSAHYFRAFSMKIVNYVAKNVINGRIRPLCTTAVVMTWRQSYVSTTNEDVLFKT